MEPTPQVETGADNTRLRVTSAVMSSAFPAGRTRRVTARDSRSSFLMQLQPGGSIRRGVQERNITSFILWCGLEGLGDIWKRFTHKIL